jgi:brefeldin A-resistance guanine nucleotide exchange factor 1
VQRAISGLRECATLAGCFDLPEVIDFIVISLSQSSSLIPESLSTSIPIYPVVKIEDQDLTVSTLSVRFGTNFKGQLAAVVLFAIANANANAIREGWTYVSDDFPIATPLSHASYQIFEIFQNLFSHSLLPARIMQMEEFLGGVCAIPLKGSNPLPRQANRTDGGLLSALSSYLMAPYSEVTIPEATEGEIETTLCTVDCLAACRLEELYGQIV